MKPNSLPIFTEVKVAAQLPQSWPLLRLGFRPFYIGGALIATATLWSAAFLIYLWIYTPWLMSTRLDGKDG